MKVLVIDFNRSSGYYESSIENVNRNELLEEFYRIINCQTVDVVSYNKELSIVVDDEGLFNKNNIIHELLREEAHSHPLQLAGGLIFVRDNVTDEGIEFIGLEVGDILNLNMNLQIRPINWQSLNRTMDIIPSDPQFNDID